MKVRSISFGTGLHFVLPLLMILLFSNLHTPGQILSDINYQQNYEDVTDLEDLGYQWNTMNPNNTIQVLISSDFSYTGNNSLVIESYVFTATTLLIIPLDLVYNKENYFSLYFYSFGYRISTIRLVFTDAFGQSLFLDYSEPDNYWKSDFTFNMGLVFPKDEWFRLSRDLMDDVEFAVNSEESPYSNGYVPTKISSLHIFQPYNDGLHVNFIDDLMLTNVPLAELDFDGNDDLTKYRNIGRVDPLTRGPIDTEEQKSDNVIAPYVTNLGFPIDGVKLITIIMIPIAIGIIVLIVVKLIAKRRKLD